MNNVGCAPQKIGMFQSWFEVYEVSKGTFAICEPRHAEGVVSHFFEGRKKAVLFDAEMAIGTLKKLLSILLA